MNNIERINTQEELCRPEYEFIDPGTLIFITGAPLSGKSTIAPLIVSTIEGCVLQNMDIIRLVAQEIESYKPERERNAFVNYGACDSYVAIGDGFYTPENLITGYNAYSMAVSYLLESIIPKLEAQGTKDVVFEGVQLTPSLVAPYLTNSNKLVIITADKSRFKKNRDKMFQGNQGLIKRYSVDKLLFLQNEILRQSKEISPEKILCVDNTSDYLNTVDQIVQFLLTTSVIKPV